MVSFKLLPGGCQYFSEKPGGLGKDLEEKRGKQHCLGRTVRMSLWQKFLNFLRASPGYMVIEKGSRTIGIECKDNTAPNPVKGFRQALKDLNIAEAYLVAPVENSYPVEQGIQVVPVLKLLARIQRTSA